MNQKGAFEFNVCTSLTMTMPFCLKCHSRLLVVVVTGGSVILVHSLPADLTPTPSAGSEGPQSQGHERVYNLLLQRRQQVIPCLIHHIIFHNISSFHIFYYII